MHVEHAIAALGELGGDPVERQMIELGLAGIGDAGRKIELGRPVHLETVIDDEPARLHYNGEEHDED